jgi:hypothetical protein
MQQGGSSCPGGRSRDKCDFRTPAFGGFGHKTCTTLLVVRKLRAGNGDLLLGQSRRALLGWWKNTRGHQLGPRRTRQLIALRCAVELLVNFLEFLAKQPCHQYQRWRASKDSRILFVNCDQFFVGFEVVVWHLLAYASECLDKMEAGGGEFSL